MAPGQWSCFNDGPIPICIRALQTDLSDLYKEKIKDMKLGGDWRYGVDVIGGFGINIIKIYCTKLSKY